MNENFDYDLVVIGAGTAGLVAATVADSLGARVAMVEKNRIGGECLWTGCVPSKTLIKAARVFDIVKRAEEFGVRLENPRIQWSAVQLRLEAVRDEIKVLERKELAKTKIEIISGAARFEDESTLRIQSQKGEIILRAEKFILATGLQPRQPEIHGLQNIGYLTNEQIFKMRNLPRSWVIIGGGPIGCEMAQALVRFNCKVTLLQHSGALLPKEDTDVSAATAKILRNEGVNIVLNAKIESAQMDGEKKQITFRTIDPDEENGRVETGDERTKQDSHETTQSVSAAEILVATGKVAKFEELNLKAAGVLWNDKGVTVNDFLQTTSSRIWACGDVTGKLLFTHVAEAQAKIAAQNALLPVKKKWDERVVPWTTFIDPEVARVGLTEDEARSQFRDVKVYRQEFSTLDRAIIEGETQGFLKVVTTSSGRIVGAHIVGPSAGELIHAFVAAVRDETLIQEFAETIHVYPTHSEIGHRAGNEAYREVLENKWVQAALKKVVG